MLMITTVEMNITTMETIMIDTMDTGNSYSLTSFTGLPSQSTWILGMLFAYIEEISLAGKSRSIGLSGTGILSIKCEVGSISGSYSKY